MARLIALSFLALPLLEIAVFILVGRAIGLFPTLALVILAALGGGLLLRQQGLSTLSRLRNNVSAGTIPGRAMFDAMLIGVAAILLVLPGFLSDVLALTLLVPPVRNWLFSALASRVRVVETTTSYRRHEEPETPHDGDAKVIEHRDEDDPKPRQ